MVLTSSPVERFQKPCIVACRFTGKPFLAKWQTFLTNHSTGHAGAGGRGSDAAPPGAGRLSGHRRRISAAAFLGYAGRGAREPGATRGRPDGAARGPGPG